MQAIRIKPNKAIGIKSIRSIGVKPTLDLEVNHPDHNFYAEGAVVSNSHSIAYATLSAITVYLKFKYPQQFFLSLLKMTRHEPDPIGEISKIQSELRHFGIQLRPPHILRSQMDFSIEGDDIRFGLLSIKGISDKSIEKLDKFKHEYSNKFEVFQAAEEAGIPLGILCSLIMAGVLAKAVDKQPRTRVVLEAQLWNLLKPREKQYCLDLGAKYKYDLIDVFNQLQVQKDEKGKPIISKKENDPAPDNGKKKRYRYDTIKKAAQPYIDIHNKNRVNEDFARYYYENHLLGFSYSKPLREVVSGGKFELKSLEEVMQLKQNASVRLTGVVEEVVQGVSKAKGTKYFRMTVRDETAKANVLIFNDQIEACKITNNNHLPEAGNIVNVEGQRKNDAVFAERIVVQDHKIFTRLSELKSVDKSEKTTENNTAL